MNRARVVIVESPTKARKIKNFLGKDFIVVSSLGHICNLPEKELGVKNGWIPLYEVIPDKKSLVKELRNHCKDASMVYLASDPDREGEAIADHLAKRLELHSFARVKYNAVTRDAVLNGLKTAGEIDNNLVEAQHARRVLDRLIGWLMSYLASSSLSGNFSVGRVQTVGLRFIVEREEEIQGFVKQNYYQLVSSLEKEKLEAILTEWDGKKIPDKFNDKDFLDKVASSLGEFAEIKDISKTEKKENPPEPLTTSRLQQIASSHLKLSPKETMLIAQKLYENGFITYMRTDSTRIEPNFLEELKKEVLQKFGEKYVLQGINKTTKKENVQDAHEAIRPTNLKQVSIDNEKEKALYLLIEKYTLASAMSPALFMSCKMVMIADDANFVTSWNERLFDGWRKILPPKEEMKNSFDFSVNQKIALNPRVKTKKTRPSNRYTEASLIAAMEKKGIGRPATYSAILSTIFSRGYVELDSKRNLVATNSGRALINYLNKVSPSLISYTYTAEMEKELDKVALGETTSKEIAQNLFSFLNNLLEKVDRNVRWTFNENGKLEKLKSSMACPECGSPMFLKNGKNGSFLACSGYPECKSTLPCDESGNPVKRETKTTKHKCQKCGKPMVLRNGKNGSFLACSGYPECKSTLPCDENGNPVKRETKTTKHKCQKCGKPMVLRNGKNGSFLACSGYPECKSTLTCDENGNPVKRETKVT